ncbi:bucentaur or craniofacial development-domain-containing protein [Aspergillus caelatus]|uniref:SWR1-complex protein 5 n=1 Tax=Aspergillus caelatus TaxID=61420 RepID=A0A5N7A9H7_9EURO|nr:bucentaur or craniofacial development-domain-containing protein [Aspergillus caelatus]KAE8366293.1 bucentaur or craniofacial development-domain-containing protein [Aspergillus caelatus]
MSANPATVPDLDLEDEQYDSADDEDFQVEAAQEDDDLTGSDSDDEPIEPATKKRKAGNKALKQEDNNLDSGDEATIQKAKSKKAKKQKGKDEDGDDEDDVGVDFDDEEGGPGGFVRTRAMKMRTQEERKPLAKIDGATVDVDALWEKMNAPDTTLGPNPEQTEQKNDPSVEENKDTEMRDGESPVTEEKRQASQYSEEMVKIKRTYKFAGEWITEEKVVPKDSAEAKLYMANEKDVETVTATENAAVSKETIKIRRPLRKVSRFDPNPTGSIKKSWDKQPIAETTQENARGPKINTVEKSRLDWAAYVDQAGIKDELKTHSKAKEGFLGRMDFLDRVGAKQEEERRNMRLKGL